MICNLITNFFIGIYNKFKDKDRASLTSPTLFNYMYVNVNMGPLEKFDPSSTANFWLQKNKRKPQSQLKSRKQDWFNGVFEEAENKEKNPSNVIIEF